MRLRLAAGAEERGAAGVAGPDDGAAPAAAAGAAPPGRRPGAGAGSGPAGPTARRTACRQGGAAGGDRRGQHRADGRVERPDLPGVERCRPAGRSAAGPRAAPRRCRCCRGRRRRCWSSRTGLDRPRAGRARRARSIAAVRPSTSGIRAEPAQLGDLDLGPRRVEHDDLAERPGIDEPQLLAAGQRHGDVACGAGAARRPGRAQLAAHAQVDHHGVAGVERGRRGTCPAGRGGHRRAGQPGDDGLGATCAAPCARRPTSTRSMRRPTTWASSPRRTTSTSGSSGIGRARRRAAGRRRAAAGALPAPRRRR